MNKAPIMAMVILRKNRQRGNRKGVGGRKVREEKRRRKEGNKK